MVIPILLQKLSYAAAEINMEAAISLGLDFIFYFHSFDMAVLVTSGDRNKNNTLFLEL